MSRSALLLVVSIAVAVACGSNGKNTKDDPPKLEATKPEPKVEPGPPAEGDIVTEEVTYESGGTTLNGYLAYDKSITEPRPGILVVHEWWGHNEYVRARARALAQMGYTAFAVDMYGDGKLADNPGDAQKYMKEVMSDLPAGVARFEAASKLLREHSTTDPEKIAAIGYCFGGGVVLHMARIGADLDGIASFHGTLSPNAEVKQGDIKAKLLVCHGAADPFVPAEQVDAFKTEMEGAGADMKFIAYEGAKHAFTNPGATELGKKFKLPLAYDKAADEASWAALDAFLKELYAQ